MKIEKIRVDLIDYDESQPRKSFENIGQLASNICKQGLIKPIEVRKKGKRFILVDGERRLRAVNLLKKEEIECMIYDGKKDIYLRQLSGDFHKHKLNLVEQAEAINKLKIDGYTTNEICNVLGIKKTAYYSRLKILKLSPRSKNYVLSGKITLSNLHSMSNVDLREEERIIERIVSEKPDSENKVRRIIIEETDMNYMMNEYASNCYNFESKLKILNKRLGLYKEAITKEKASFIESNNRSLKDHINKTIELLQSILELIKW